MLSLVWRHCCRVFCCYVSAVPLCGSVASHVVKTRTCNVAMLFCQTAPLRLYESATPTSDTYVVLQFTNMGQGFQGTLDYVLYTTNSLVPTATLELPDEFDIKDSRNLKAGLPNEVWSSDHIALLAEFQYKQT